MQHLPKTLPEAAAVHATPATHFVAELTESAIDLNQVLRRFIHPQNSLPGENAIGARVLFSGEIRGANHGQTVVQLEYTAHRSLALKHITDVLQAAAEKYPLIGALCVHRLGMLSVADCAVAVLTCGRHRKEAFAANQYIIDRVKAETPIWKREFFADGSSKWGENCH